MDDPLIAQMPNRMVYRLADYDCKDSLLKDMGGFIVYLISHRNWVITYPAYGNSGAYILEFAPQDTSLNVYVPEWTTVDDLVDGKGYGGGNGFDGNEA